MLAKTNGLALLDTIYKSHQVQTPHGEWLKLHSHISKAEGQFVYDFIANDTAISCTLEIGCAYGLSSLWICSALDGRTGASHTILDPFQQSDWKGIGLKNLTRAGFKSFELKQEFSEITLPNLVGKQTFDLIFIDGLHTFDQVMVEAYYGLKLLRVGGVLIFDDADYPGIARVIAHLETYPCIERAGSVGAGFLSRKSELVRAVTPAFVFDRLSAGIRHKYSDQYTMVALRKISEDKREWDWHAEF